MTRRGSKPRNVRDNNIKVLLNLYRCTPLLSVSKIAQETHLSRTTVNKINDSLLQKNIIHPQGKGDSTGEGGKKPQIYSLNADYGCIVCFHIKYEKIYLRLFDMRLETIHREEETIPRNAPIEMVLPRLHHMLKNSMEAAINKPLIAVVMAVHGTVDREKGTLFHSTYFPSWGLNIPLIDLFRDLTDIKIPVYLDNWINYKTHAAKEKGVTRNLSSFVLIDAGYHGVVAGIFHEDKPYIGEHNLAGEVGHMVIDPNDTRICQCGGRGCLESLIFTERIEAEALELRDSYPDSMIFQASDNPDIEKIIEGFLQKDPLSRHLLTKVAHWLAIGISNINLLIDPQLIILEGEYAKAGSDFLNLIREKYFKVSMVRNTRRAEIILNEAHSSATLLGAASFAIGKHLQEIGKSF
jgi:predicted NBD/HSP70 family sugar kinase